MSGPFAPTLTGRALDLMYCIASPDRQVALLFTIGSQTMSDFPVALDFFLLASSRARLEPLFFLLFSRARPIMLGTRATGNPTGGVSNVVGAASMGTASMIRLREDRCAKRSQGSDDVGKCTGVPLRGVILSSLGQDFCVADRPPAGRLATAGHAGPRGLPGLGRFYTYTRCA